MLTKLPSLLKRAGKYRQNQNQDQPDQMPNDWPQKRPADFIKQKELDKKLFFSLNGKKVPTLKQFKYLNRVLNRNQKLTIGGLSLLILACLISIGIIFYTNNFITIPTVGGEYTEGLVGAPQYINPLLSQTNDVDADIARLVFAGLLRYDQNLQLVPDLASAWEISEDQKIYTFTLKPNLKWHDGQPLTADDIIFTFSSIKDPDFKSPLLISFRGVEIKKVNDSTIQFILPEAFPSFLEVLTFGILPEHIWSDIPPINANLTEFNLKPIGSGPWKFKSLAKDKLGNIKSYTLIPNPDYHGPKPYLKQLTFKFYPDFITASAALKNHSVDGISFLPKDLKPEINGLKSVKLYSLYLPQYTAMFFNQKQNENLKEKTLRQALAHSIDKSKILSEALQLEGEIINGPLLPVTLSDDEEKKMNFDPAKAEELIGQLGWKKINAQDYLDYLKAQTEAENSESDSTDTDQESTQTDTNDSTVATTSTAETLETETTNEPTLEFYWKKDDKILELTVTTVNQPENVKAAGLIKKLWENIGIKVNLNIVESGKISREIIKPRNYEILLFGIIVGSNPDPYPFWHSSQIQDPGLNLAQFANREADKLLEEAKATADPEVQQQKYQRFQEILAAELPAIFLYNPTYTYVVDKKIKGNLIDRIITPADRFNDLEEWYVKTKRQLKTAVN
ncbi:MAG: peptide ABC transporter substrate-binding protein [Patescibacteria group bacterium]|nr:peptide ABC transporter substrate-binding protein [Patescibacteria group bacterium]